MKKVLIFGGTTEGRLIAGTLAKSGIQCQVRVATEYGEQVMEPEENVTVAVGRLSLEEMMELCCQDFSCVVDATHPFATVVSKNIRSACKNKLPLIRFERKTEQEHSPTASYFSTTEACIQALKNTSGKILLTTGSKDLHLFARDPELKKRLVVRVLPGLESLKLCYDAGLEGKQIIAMQGPFSAEMNRVTLKEYGIQILVTKESGKTGGLEEKLFAALDCGVKSFVIQNPAAMEKEEGQDSVSTCSQLYSRIEALIGIKIQKNCSLKIVLAGLGPGSEECQTVAVQKALEQADYVFGAERMISEIKTGAKKMPYYLAKDVVPVLENLQQENSGLLRIVVLFSGDTGFFSGQSKLRMELEKLKGAEISVLPGISSIQMLSAQAGIDWQDAKIISLHGVQEENWLPELTRAIQEKKKIFLLTSGPQDVQAVGKLLMDLNPESSAKVFAGYNLSYKDEKLMVLSGSECLSVTEKGLYSLLIFFKI